MNETTDPEVALSDAVDSEADGPPRCPCCDYDLTSRLEAPERRCPECGRHWTIEELALQRSAHVFASRSPIRRLRWALAPGSILCLVVVVGMMVGGFIMIMAASAAIVYTVACAIVWRYDLYRMSFCRGRSDLNRTVYVFGGTIALVGVTLAQIALGVLFVRFIVTGSGA